jgi:hypothetical protein
MIVVTLKNVTAQPKRAIFKIKCAILEQSYKSLRDLLTNPQSNKFLPLAKRQKGIL